MSLRDESKPIRDGDVWNATNAIKRIRRNDALSYSQQIGACACGRWVVPGDRTQGTFARDEFHSRRRCIVKRVYFGTPRW